MASISPLRYPGGKAKLYNIIKEVIEQQNITNCTYIEPFAGGAGIALQLLLNKDVTRIVINDVDKAVYSFWHAILQDTNEFIGKIIETPVTIDEWYKQKKIYETYNKKYSLDFGFAAFFLNRTNRSGIITAGPIGGYDQDGTYKIDCRFNKEKLIEKIKLISDHKSNIQLYNKDIRSFISKYLPKYEQNGFVYFDPPYYNKGSLLYQNFFTPLDHKQLSEAIRKGVACNWIITYDCVDEIKAIYKEYITKDYYIDYSLAKKRKGKETLIFKNSNCIPQNKELGFN